MQKDSNENQKRLLYLKDFQERHALSTPQVGQLFLTSAATVAQYRQGRRKTSKRLIACMMIWERDQDLWMEIRDEINKNFHNEFGR